MENIKLTVEKREETGKEKVGRLRKTKCVPAVIYGKGIPNINIKLPEKEFNILKKIDFSENTLIDLTIKGEKKLSVLIKDFQVHPLTDEVIHVDFVNVSLTDKIKVKVPIKTQGEPEGVKQGGTLEYVLRELEVECLPKDIPETIEIDVSLLKLGESIHVKDINIQDNIKILTPQTDVVIALIAHKDEAEEKPEGAEATTEEAEPEVIKEKQKEKEEEKA